MPNFVSLLAPLALLLPVSAGHNDAVPLTPKPPTEAAEIEPEWLMLEGANGVPVQYQIRIERRVVIRVSPYRPTRTNLNATTPRPKPPKLVERKIGKCINIKSIGAVRPTRDNKLMLYMRDQRLISANLEKACSARDFYQGFYVEPNKDGNLCVERDKLQSRTGAKCEVQRIRQLVRERT